MYILIRSCVSTDIIALFVYENGHVCITATPLGSSFRIALYIRKVLIFGWRGSHDPYVLEYDICFLLYVYSIWPWLRPMEFFPIWFDCCLLMCVCLQYFCSHNYLFCSKRRAATGIKWYFRYPFSAFKVWEVLLCITCDFQQPNIIGALIHCFSGSLPRTGSKILWRDFQLGKCKATWCSKSFKTLHPWTASATPHCRISQSFPRCAEWVVPFLSLLKELISVQRSASLLRNKLNNNNMSSPEKKWA